MADFAFHFHYLLAIQHKMLRNKLHFFLRHFYYVEFDVRNSKDPSVIATKLKVGHRCAAAIITVLDTTRMSQRFRISFIIKNICVYSAYVILKVSTGAISRIIVAAK